MTAGATQRLGKLGEDFAAEFLEQSGYVIVARNFRFRGGEIDLVAQKGEVLAFVEVKARAFDHLARPASAVTLLKQRKIIQTAQVFLAEHPSEFQPRFDVFEAILTKQAPFRVVSHNHITSAFEANDKNCGFWL